MAFQESSNDSSSVHGDVAATAHRASAALTPRPTEWSAGLLVLPGWAVRPSPAMPASTDYYDVVCSAQVEHFRQGDYFLEYYRRIYQRHVPADRTVPALDLGCGAGAFLSWLRHEGFSDLTGVDGSPAALEEARVRGELDVHRADLRAFVVEAPAGRWGLVALNDVIEHFEADDAIALMREVRRLARPTATVLLKTPNMHNPLALARRYCDLTHRNGFTVPSLRQLFALAGLEPVFIGPEPTPPLYRRGLGARASRAVALAAKTAASAAVWGLNRHLGIEGPFWLADNLIAVGRVSSTDRR